MTTTTILRAEPGFEVSINTEQKTSKIFLNQHELDDLKDMEDRLRRHEINLINPPKQTFKHE